MRKNNEMSRSLRTEKQKASSKSYLYDIAASMAFEDMPLTKKEIKDLLSVENGTLSIRKLRAAILADAKK